METQVSIYLDELMAYRYLNEVKRLLPDTDTGEINYIADIEVKATESHIEASRLKAAVHKEKTTIDKIVSYFYLQANFTMFPETVKEFQKIAEVMYYNCLRKGYQKCGLSILKCIASGVLDLPSIEYPKKQEFIREGVLDILNSYGERQIISPKYDFRNTVKEIMREAKNGEFKCNFKNEELLDSYNKSEIGSKRIEKPILENELTDESEN